MRSGPFWQGIRSLTVYIHQWILKYIHSQRKCQIIHICVQIYEHQQQHSVIYTVFKIDVFLHHGFGYNIILHTMNETYSTYVLVRVWWNWGFRNTFHKKMYRRNTWCCGYIIFITLYEFSKQTYCAKVFEGIIDIFKGSYIFIVEISPVCVIEVFPAESQNSLHSHINGIV